MTTISSTAQMLLAEKVREMGGVSEGGEAAKPASPEQETIFDRFPDAWYRPNSRSHNYVVRVPEGVNLSDAGESRYYKTRQGAEKALKRWYE